MIQRWEWSFSAPGNGMVRDMERGRYVRYSDHEQAMTEKQEIITELHSDIHKMHKMIDERDEQIAGLQEHLHIFRQGIKNRDKQIAALEAALKGKKENERHVRLFLLVNHGHKAPYLDDGEMQCGECRPNWDYKRLPLKTLVNQALSLRDEQITTLTAERSDAWCLAYNLWPGDKESSDFDLCGVIHELDERHKKQITALQAENKDLRDCVENEAAKIFRNENARQATEINGWKESAAQFCRNEEYYRGLLDKATKYLGSDIFVSDDGSIQDEPLRAKVPELVYRQAKQITALKAEAQEIHDKYGKLWDANTRQSEVIDGLREALKNMDWIHHLGNPSQVHDAIHNALKQEGR